MNTEDTVYNDKEATKLTEPMEKGKKNEAVGENSKTTSSKGIAWKKVAVSGSVGILFGAASSFFMSAAINKDPDTPDPVPSPDPKPNLSLIVDESIQTATRVDDAMSFSQAFAEARAEVGPGGVFEWHGNLYGTYTAEEWDHMSAAERAEYNEHFAWANSSERTGHNGSTASDEVQVVRHETVPQTSYNAQPDDEVSTNTNGEATNDTQNAEVEVLGVEHDAESGMNFGAALVDDQEVILIDVDNDSVFEIMAVDTNQDNQITENEMADISNQRLTVDDMGGFNNSNPNANLYASTDGPDYLDYSNNDVYES